MVPPGGRVSVVLCPWVDSLWLEHKPLLIQPHAAGWFLPMDSCCYVPLGQASLPSSP